MLTRLDEFFGHQLVAPRAVVEHPVPTWAERCFHLLTCDDGLVLAAGRQLYPHAGRRFAFVGVRVGDTVVARRATAPYDRFADDPDEPAVGPIRIAAIEPLRTIRLVYDERSAPLSVDLTFRARVPPQLVDALRVEQDGEVVTHYHNFFQSGWYDGVVTVDGVAHRVSRRAGFRDRGWGVRKHEGAPRRGLVLNVTCELPAEALYAVLFETASGRRALTSAWVLDAEGVCERVERVDHDLDIDGEHRVVGGVFRFHLDGGRVRTVAFVVRSRLPYVPLGYSPDERWRGDGHERFDLGDPAVRADLDGQTANAAVFDVDGVTGYGYVESGLGVHARYRPG